MAVNDIKKNIKFNVDDKSLKSVSKIFTDMNSTTKAIFKTNQDLLKLFNAQAHAQRRTNEENKKNLETARERVNKIKEEYRLRKELRELERPKQSALEQYQRYKGLPGAFTRLSELAIERGAEKVEGYNEQIEIKQARYDKLKKKDGKRGKQYQKDIAELQVKKSEAIGESKTQANKYAAMAAAAQKVSAVFERMGQAIMNFVTKPLKDFAESVAGAVTAMLDFKSGIATYNTSSSLITNAAARESQLRYGLTASQNYGFIQAKSMLNIQSDEDLMYMNAEQRERLLAYMEHYSDWYDELQNSGVLQSIQEMQLEFEELRQEIAMEFLQWVAENKETIMVCIKGTFEFIKVVAKAVLGIIELLSKAFGGEGSSAWDLYDSASDNINNNNTNNKTTNINMNINNTNNATGVLGSQEALDKFQEENWSKLAKQVVTAIGG